VQGYDRPEYFVREATLENTCLFRFISIGDQDKDHTAFLYEVNEVTKANAGQTGHRISDITLLN
jgi:hypothetical protein